MREFRPDTLTVADGSRALAVLDALLVFKPTHPLSEQRKPLETAIEHSNLRGIARAILVTIRATRALDMATLREGWWPFIKAYWAAMADAAVTGCLAGLRAAHVLSECKRQPASSRGLRVPSRVALGACMGAPHRNDVAYGAETYWANAFPMVEPPEWASLFD